MGTLIDTALNTDMSVLLVDKKGFILSSNDHFKEMAGFKAEEIVGRHCTMLFHPDTLNDVLDRLEEGIDAQESWAGYLKTLDKEGHGVWTHTILDTLETTEELLFLSRKACKEEIRLLELE